MKKPLACKIVQEVLLTLKEKAQIGTSLLSLDKIAEDMILSYNAIPYNKGFTGDTVDQEHWQKEVKPTTPFPNALVCCVNSVIAHGNPTEYTLRDGDTVIFDIGVKKDDLCGDGAITVGIGTVENKHERLLRYARLTVLEGLKHIKAGANIADMGRAIEQYVTLRGYVVNQTFAGHGIGKEMHEDPFIPHYWTSQLSETYFEEGKMYCIEPILTFKDMWGARAFNDWAWITRDGRRCAMFETQVLVTKDGYIDLMPQLTKA